MTTLTPPRANIPIGWFKADGRRVPVEIDPEWLRYLASSLFTRSGGTTGSGTGDLETAAFDDAGIDDLKVTVQRLSDEMPVSALLGELEPMKSRIEALELAPAVDLTEQNITNNTTAGNDVFSYTFMGAL